MGLNRDLCVSSTLAHEICHREKESSWYERKVREGLTHPRVAPTHGILSSDMVWHLSDTRGSAALAGKRHMAGAEAQLPQEQMLLTEGTVFFSYFNLFQPRVCREFS